MPMSTAQEFNDFAVNPPVCGFLHQPPQPNGSALVLTHGAGANCNSKLLTALAEAFADAGWLVLRCNLPFRQARPFGPPFPALAARDRQGLLRAVEIVKQKVAGRVFLGGHSYGGRQASILAAEQLDLVAGLLLLSYPLHPPRKPAELRTAHFPQLKTPSLFVHGSRDPFGSHEELRTALALLPGKHLLMEIEGAGHELLGKKKDEDLPERIVHAFQEFFGVS
ncbi:MAG TPA: alpha/beta family hydrolase [Candidatus Angelobacter sp.]|nr:alpha/beta family hydrolase [Candidatus Angelobacter sp.]